MRELNISIEAENFISNLLQKDQDKRLGSINKDIKKDPFFEEIDFDRLERMGMLAPYIPTVVN